jgi:hypothetical protein
MAIARRAHDGRHGDQRRPPLAGRIGGIHTLTFCACRNLYALGVEVSRLREAGINAEIDLVLMVIAPRRVHEASGILMLFWKV